MARARPHWIVVPLGLLGCGLAGLLMPLSKLAAAAALALAAGLAVPGAWTHRLGAFLLRRRLASPLLLLGGLAATVGGLEAAAQIGTRLGLLAVESPMQVMLPAGSEDWRLAHIMADSYREPDPVLLWRPRAEPPYTSQRFKGPLVARPHPPGVFRIIAYGDSNTDGPARGGWTERLQAVLEASGVGRPEVLNAGVVGYTSYQGLLRFRSEVTDYQPDLVLVSFGWNEAAPALGAPDRSFVPPPAWQVRLVRGLLRYRSFLVARHLLSRRAAPPAAIGPRVSLADQAELMRGFADTARQAGARLAFLTRPTRETDAELEALGGWRPEVPAYSREMLRVGAELGVPVLDVRAWCAGHRGWFVDECHFDEAGHAAMAERLAAELAARGLLEPRASR